MGDINSLKQEYIRKKEKKKTRNKEKVNKTKQKTKKKKERKGKRKERNDFTDCTYKNEIYSEYNIRGQFVILITPKPPNIN